MDDEEKPLNPPPPYGAPDPFNVVPGEVNVQNPGQTNISAVVVNPPVGPRPSPVTCQSCGADIVTRTEYQPTTKTHLIAILLCALGCWCCVCIPYCTDSCQNSNHYCPNCNSYIGMYSA